MNIIADLLSGASVGETTKDVSLSFAGQALKLDTEKDAQVIVDAIASKSNLNILELKGNTLGVEAANAIGKALETQKEFKRALWSDLFTGRMKSEIPQALKNLCGGLMSAHACLVELDLSDNAFGPNGMNGLVDFLKSSSCYTLQELRLNNNGLGVTGGLMLADSLMECYTLSVKAGTPLALRVFVSGRGRLEDEGAKALSKAFKAMKSLVEVHMPQNGINHKGITALADAFSSNKQLRHVNLSDNTFTKRGSISMAAALRNLEHLEVINFEDCLMRADGTKALAAAMKNRHSNLKVLKLSGNEIDREAAEEIIQAVSNMQHLELLDLNCNQIGVEGVEIVKELLKSAGKVKILAPMSDDEGTEDEDEEEEGDDDDDESEHDENEVNVEDLESDTDEGVNIQDLRITGKSIAPMQETTETANSSQSATVSKVNTSTTQPTQMFIEPIQIDEKDPEKAIDLFVKMSSTVSSSDLKNKDSACAHADAIFSRLFASSGVDSSSGLVCNILLVSLGFIKDEDKRSRSPANIEGALIVLNHCVQQNYFPNNAKIMLKTFLEKSSDILVACSTTRDSLLATLNL